MAAKNCFCILPFIHIEARTDGRMAACCLSQKTLSKNSNEYFHLASDGIMEGFHSQQLTDLRKNLLNGVQDKNCEICWQEEKLGRQSRRQRENLRFNNYIDEVQKKSQPLETPIYLDLKLGNLCNLKCRICGPHSSSKWFEEVLREGESDELTRSNEMLRILPTEESRKKIINWPEYGEKFWNDLGLILPHVEWIDFFGGEPMLIDRHFEFLNKIIDAGLAQNVRLNYSTNGTYLPAKALNEVFPKFKQVFFGFSIDGLYERFEYQRTPAKFANVLENFENCRKAGFSPSVGITVSVFSIYNLFEDINFWLDKNVRINLNMLYTPLEFNISFLNSKAKAEILYQFEKKIDPIKHAALMNQLLAIKKHLLSQDTLDYTEALRKKIVQIDNRRHQSFAKTFPEWSKFILC